MHDYSTKVEKLLHELCNASTNGKPDSEAKAIRSYIKEITLTTYVEGLLPHLKSVIKARNFETLEAAMKASLEEQKIYESTRDTQRIIRGGTQYKNINQKSCNICNRNNHMTNQCRYANRNQDTGQQNPQYTNNKEIKKKTCTFCNKAGHSENECYKKKNANTNKVNGRSGNGQRSDGTGSHSVKALKNMALEPQEPSHSRSN